MRLLVDTHLLIWTANDPARLSRAATDLIADTANDVMFSTVSMAEVSIQMGAGPARLSGRAA